MNKNIFEKSRKNRELEQRLFQEHDKRQSEYQTKLSAQDVLKILQKIYKDSMSAVQPSQSALHRYEIISTIYQYLPKRGDYLIPPQIKSSLQLSELSLQFLNGLSEQHEEMQRLMQLLALSWAQLSVHSPEFLQVKQHPAKITLSKLLMLSECWDHRSGDLAKKLLEGIRLVLSQLNQKASSPRLYEQATNRILSLENVFHQYRTSRLKKIIEHKRKVERETKAETFIADYIASKIEGIEFPVFLIEFLENFMSPHLKKIFMETGPVGQKWHQAIEDSEILIWSIMSTDYTNYVDEYDKKVPSALKRLYTDLEKLLPDSTALQHFFYELEELHIKKRQGERLDLHTIISATDILETSHINKNNFDLIDNEYNEELLTDDDWYYLIQSGKRFRCQLIPRDYTGKWLVFVNLSGTLVAEFNTESPGFSLKHLPIVPIETHDYWEELTEYLDNTLTQRVEFLEKHLSQIEKEAAADQARKMAAEEEARALIREKIKEERELQEQKRKKLEEEKQKALEVARKEEEKLSKRRLKAKKEVESLLPGAVVSYMTPNKEKQELILNIISTTTSKYIFIDNQGQRRLDPFENDLIELFATEKLKLVKQGKDFNQALQSLVIEQRQAHKDKNQI